MGSYGTFAHLLSLPTHKPVIGLLGLFLLFCYLIVLTMEWSCSMASMCIFRAHFFAHYFEICVSEDDRVLILPRSDIA